MGLLCQCLEKRKTRRALRFTGIEPGSGGCAHERGCASHLAHFSSVTESRSRPKSMVSRAPYLSPENGDAAALFAGVGEKEVRGTAGALV